MKRYILTGAPGSGKTTLLHILKNRGYYCVEEAATDIIHNEQSSGISEPWADPAFIIKVLQLQIQRENLAYTSNAELQLFDRSPICTYALCTFLNYTIPQELQKEVNRIIRDNIYETNVFFIDNLGYIEPTAARKINFNDALKFEKLHKNIYQLFGYQLIHIPYLEIQKRTDTIINMLHSPAN